MRNVNKISGDTIARTVVLGVAILNQIFAILGKDKISIAESDIYQIITLAFTVGSSVVAWWRNNNFTKEARLAQNVLDQLKEKGEIENVDSDR